MKICIIGTGGFLANNLAGYWQEENHSIFHYGRRNTGSYDNASFRMIDLAKDKIPISDLLDMDYIIYAAAVGVQSSQSVSSPDMFQVNCFTPIWICQQLEIAGFTGKWLSFGSYFEIGSDQMNMAYNEVELLSSPNKLPNQYCLSKKMLSIYFGNSQHSFPFYHLILPTIYGNGEANSRLIPFTIHSIKNKTPLSFTAGTQIRQYLHILDAVRVVTTLLNSNAPSGVYNSPAAETLTIKEIVKIICDGLNTTFDESWFGSESRRDDTMKTLMLDNQKFNSLVGISEFNKIAKIIQNINYDEKLES